MGSDVRPEESTGSGSAWPSSPLGLGPASGRMGAMRADGSWLGSLPEVFARLVSGDAESAWSTCWGLAGRGRCLRTGQGAELFVSARRQHDISEVASDVVVGRPDRRVSTGSPADHGRRGANAPKATGRRSGRGTTAVHLCVVAALTMVTRVGLFVVLWRRWNFEEEFTWDGWGRIASFMARGYGLADTYLITYFPLGDVPVPTAARPPCPPPCSPQSCVHSGIICSHRDPPVDDRCGDRLSDLLDRVASAPEERAGRSELRERQAIGPHSGRLWPLPPSSRVAIYRRIFQRTTVYVALHHRLALTPFITVAGTWPRRCDLRLRRSHQPRS